MPSHLFSSFSSLSLCCTLLLYPYSPSFHFYLYHPANFILFLSFLIKFYVVYILSQPPVFLSATLLLFLDIYLVHYRYLLVLPNPIVSFTTTGPFLHFLYSDHLYPCSIYVVTLKTDISTYLPNYIDNHNPEDTNFHSSCCKNI